MMYFLFRFHNVDPRDYTNMGFSTRKVFRAFMEQEIEDRAKEYGQ